MLDERKLRRRRSRDRKPWQKPLLALSGPNRCLLTPPTYILCSSCGSFDKKLTKLHKHPWKPRIPFYCCSNSLPTLLVSELVLSLFWFTFDEIYFPKIKVSTQMTRDTECKLKSKKTQAPTKSESYYLVTFWINFRKC